MNLSFFKRMPWETKFPGAAWALIIVMALSLAAGCDTGGNAVDPGEDTGDGGFEKMLKDLGVNMNPADPKDPKGKALPASYNPLGAASGGIAASAASRAVSGSGGRVSLYPLSEIYLAGLKVNSDGAYSALYEDFKDGWACTPLAADTKDEVWLTAPKKSIAADFNGDGYDEVLIAVVYLEAGQIALRLGKGASGAFTKEVRKFSYPGGADALKAALPDTTKPIGSAGSGWVHEARNARVDIAAGDMDGDGKAEAVLVVGGEIFLLDDAGTNFATTATLSKSIEDGQTFYQAACADYDQDGKDEWVLSYASIANLNAQFTIYKNNSVTPLGGAGSSGEVKLSTDTAALKSVNVVTGDFDGDGLPETAFCGKAAGSGNNYRLFILDTEMDADSRPEFSFMPFYEDISCGSEESDPVIPALAAGDMDGDGKDEIFAFTKILSLDTGKNDFTERWARPGGNGLVMYDKAVMGDVTGDKKADLVCVTWWGSATVGVIYVNDGGIFTYFENPAAVDTGGGSGSFLRYPTLALPNVDDDSYVLEYTGRDLRFTDPDIQVVLASPPFYAEANNGEGGTVYGKSSGAGASSGESHSFNVGVSVGYEWDTGVFGNCGAEFSVNVNNSFTWGASASKEVTETFAYSTGVGEDKVIFTCVPFDVYYYNVISAPPDNTDGDGGQALTAGGVLTVSVPRKPGTYHQSVAFYNEHNGDNADVTLPHTLGQPFSYTNQAGMQAIKSGNNGNGLYTTISKMRAGRSDTGTSSLNIEEVDSTESTFNYDLDISVEFAVKFGGAKVGGSLGYGYGYERSSTISTGIFIEGEVPDIPTAAGAQFTEFNWGLLMYPCASDGQSYNMVTYWVDE